jgi:hypothetical protein
MMSSQVAPVASWHSAVYWPGYETHGVVTAGLAVGEVLERNEGENRAPPPPRLARLRGASVRAGGS